MADRVIFVCTLMLAAVYFYATSQIPSLQIGDPLGPKAFPYLLGIGLLITAGMLLAEILRARKAPDPHETALHEKEDRSHLLVIGAVVLWTGIYFGVFELLGYMIATTVYLFVLMSYFNRGKWLANALTSVLFCVGSYLLFSHVLGVSLARGPLNF